MHAGPAAGGVHVMPPLSTLFAAFVSWGVYAAVKVENKDAVSDGSPFVSRAAFRGGMPVKDSVHVLSEISLQVSYAGVPQDSAGRGQEHCGG